MISLSGLDLSFLRNKPAQKPEPAPKRKRGRPKKVVN